MYYYQPNKHEVANSSLRVTVLSGLAHLLVGILLCLQAILISGCAEGLSVTSKHNVHSKQVEQGDELPEHVQIALANILRKGSLNRYKGLYCVCELKNDQLLREVAARYKNKCSPNSIVVQIERIYEDDLHDSLNDVVYVPMVFSLAYDPNVFSIKAIERIFQSSGAFTQLSRCVSSTAVDGKVIQLRPCQFRSLAGATRRLDGVVIMRSYVYRLVEFKQVQARSDLIVALFQIGVNGKKSEIRSSIKCNVYLRPEKFASLYNKRNSKAVPLLSEQILSVEKVLQIQPYIDARSQ